MTILTQKIGSGPTRVCNGTCHHAKAKKCACICGGRYHGKGGFAAALLARDWVGEDWTAAKAQAVAQGDELSVSGLVRDAINQMALPFDGGDRA